jgi:transaldolase
MSKLHEVSAQGQSIWLDNLRRDLVSSGELQRFMTEDAVTGVTSNPTILAAAISDSRDYDAHVAALARQGATVDELYVGLVAQDIRDACDVLRPVWERTDGADGFVSVEVSPAVSDDADATIVEARDWVKRIDRENLLVKVPANETGLSAIQRLTAEGVSVNVTLIFSLDRYRAVADAYVTGLESFVASGGDPSGIVSFASFFVSRVDTEVDRRLTHLSEHSAPRVRRRLTELKGKAGIANARVAYGIFQDVVSSDRWLRLARKGARAQQPLWASTGVKDPAYRDTMYVEELIAPQTVNTLPEGTIRAFQDHGDPGLGPFGDDAVREARSALASLDEFGVDLSDVTAQLERDGIATFASSFVQLRQRLQEELAAASASPDRGGKR